MEKRTVVFAFLKDWFLAAAVGVRERQRNRHRWTVPAALPPPPTGFQIDIFSARTLDSKLSGCGGSSKFRGVRKGNQRRYRTVYVRGSRSRAAWPPGVASICRGRKRQKKNCCPGEGSIPRPCDPIADASSPSRPTTSLHCQAPTSSMYMYPCAWLPVAWPGAGCGRSRQPAAARGRAIHVPTCIGTAVPTPVRAVGTGVDLGRRIYGILGAITCILRKNKK